MAKKTTEQKATKKKVTITVVDSLVPEMTLQEKADYCIKHIRLKKHFKLCILEAQCGIPSNYLSKQLNGANIMQPKHYDALYDYLKKTAFVG